LPLGKDDQGRDVIVRVGRYGPYLQRGEDTASLAEDMPPDEVTLAKAIELLDKPSGDRLLGTDPESGLPVYVRSGRFGGYVQLGEAGGKEKPRTGSLLKSMTPASATLEEALQMLSLPRVVGNHPESKEPITAQLGRYGPYISCGKDSRSIEKEEDVFSITVEQALLVLAQPKTRGRRKEAPPLKELGKDEVSGGTITLREGRFGWYVTDGETNASLPKGDSHESIENARAQELLQTRRERGPVTKKKKVKKKASAASAKAAKPTKASKAAASDEADTDTDAETGGTKSSRPPASARVAAKKSPAKKLAGSRPSSKKPAKKSAVKAASNSHPPSGRADSKAPASKKRPTLKPSARAAKTID